LSLTPKAKGVKYTSLLMMVVGIFFAIPGILYIGEGGPMIALLPLFLALLSFIISYGLYILKKWAWIAAVIIAFVGLIIFGADWVNVNIESYLGGFFCIILIISLVMNRRYYL
jgi:hypothetical protein